MPSTPASETNLPHAGQPECAILADPANDPALTQQAQSLAQQLHLPVLMSKENQDAALPELLLAVTLKRLELRWAEPAEQTKIAARKKSSKPAKPVTGAAIYADWSSLNIASAAGTSIKQPIAKAIGLKSIYQQPAVRVIDTTAGWGEDAWVMASLGCHVLMIERNPLIAAMLNDAIARERARSPQTVGRLRVVNDDATAILNRLASGQSLVSQHEVVLKDSVWDETSANPQHACAADVIHLDPMFPGEKTSAEKKPIRLLRRLVGDDPDSQALYEAAMALKVKRVIVKRPPHGQALGDKPQITIAGKASRYDVYVSHTS